MVTTDEEKQHFKEIVLKYQALALRYQAGDERAFQTLYNSTRKYQMAITEREFAKMPPRILKREVRDAVAVALYKTAKDWKPEKKASFRTYFRFKVRGELSSLRYQVLGDPRNNSGHGMRKTKNFSEIDTENCKNLAELSYEPEEPKDYEQINPRVKSMLRSLNGLSNRKKRMIYLRYGLGKSPMQIEVALNTTKDRISYDLTTKLELILSEKARTLDIPWDYEEVKQAIREWFEEQQTAQVA